MTAWMHRKARVINVAPLAAFQAFDPCSATSTSPTSRSSYNLLAAERCHQARLLGTSEGFLQAI